MLKIGDAQHEECHVEREEQEEEGDGGFQGAEDKDEGEDEPPLKHRVSERDSRIVTYCGNLTIKKNPTMFSNPLTPSASTIVSSISKPPGVRRMAKEIQKPP